MRQSTAQILNHNRAALSIAASAGRMSTQAGTALEIYARSGDESKDLNLIRKVLSSGHKSVIEHQTLSVAFNDVSVMVEQFIIEFRLASFTVKSRRYVDFSDAGYVVPTGMDEARQAAYRSRMDSLFQAYGRLLEMGIPKEDARFLFPYCLRSNFFMTINARELIHMICTMISGRGSRFEELHSLGMQLKEQFDALYPDVIGAEAPRYACYAEEALPAEIKVGKDVAAHAELIGRPNDSEALLEDALAFSGRFQPIDGKFLHAGNMRRLLNDPRPRELEILNYTFRVKDISLACLTHFTRHRMQSPLIPSVLRALRGGNYVLPESIAANPEAEEIYRRAFAEQADAARGLPAEVMIYYAMSGHVLDFLMTVNARELLLFGKLRTCTRAQWEIRAVAREMLAELNVVSPEIFGGYGPSCAVTGKCPEGRMTCGRPVHIENGIWTYKN